MRFVAWTALNLGRPLARLLSSIAGLYVLLYSKTMREASKKYLRKVLGARPGLTNVLRHFNTYAVTSVDRVFLLRGQFHRFDVRLFGLDVIKDAVDRNQGCLLIGSHLGSFEIIRAIGTMARAPRVRMVMYEEAAQKLSAVFNAINPELTQSIIALNKPDSMLKVEAALETGEFVGILADRTIQGEGTIECRFLGEKCFFPSGPFIAAIVLKRPIVLMFGLYRGGNRYDVHFERFPDLGGVGPSTRADRIERSVRAYAGRLEHFCRLAPYNWFNFYDFWK